MKISRRAELTPFSPIRKFVPLLEKAKQEGKKVFELHIGQPDLATPKQVLKTIKSFSEKTISYTPSPGIKETRLAWQQYFNSQGLKFDFSEIIVTIGGSEAISFALASIADDGDEVLVFEPFYANYSSYASILGIRLAPLTTFAKDGFHLPEAKTIIRAINKKTRGIIVCNPNNPTGTVYSKKELTVLAKIAKKYDLFVLADETYREFVYDQAKHISLMDFPKIRDRVILLDSVSKRFNSCGARIGCLASKNQEVIVAAAKFAQARLSSPTIEQLAVIPLLENSLKYTREIALEYRRRRDVVFKALKDMPEILAVKPQGAFYAVLKLPIKDSDHFAQWLLTEFRDNNKTLLVAPGSGFYASPELGHDEIRIAFVLSCPKLKQAMRVFKKALKTYLKKHETR